MDTNAMKQLLIYTVIAQALLSKCHLQQLLRACANKLSCCPPAAIVGAVEGKDGFKKLFPRDFFFRVVLLALRFWLWWWGCPALCCKNLLGLCQDSFFMTEKEENYLHASLVLVWDLEEPEQTMCVEKKEPIPE